MKRILSISLLALLPIFGACMGPDNAYQSLRNWNAGATSTDIVDEIIFIGLWIIPVYPIVGLSDIVIFNTIEYWTGDSPLKPAGPFPTEEFNSKKGE